MARLSKYQKVKDLLRQQVVSGEFAPGSKLPPDSELHTRFKVHRLTVIRALQDLAQEGLIVRRRGSGTFVANNSAMSLIPGRSAKIGILWRFSISPERMRNSFLGVATIGALEAVGLNFQNAAWSLPSETEATCAQWTDQHAQIHVTCLGEARNVQVRHPPLEAIRAHQFDGVVAMGILEDSFLDQLLELGIPVVLADVLKERLNGRIDQVFVDPLNGYQQAVEHFVRMGLTRIHFVAAQIPLPAPSAEMSLDRFRAFHGNRVRVDPDSYLRLSAYRQAMDACGLEVRDSFTHGLSGVLENDADLGIRLAALPEQQRPEAVVCHESTQADALIEAFERRGLPLVGAGALHTGTPKKAYPIQVDMKAVGATAMELLMSRIQRSRRPCLRVGVPMVTPSSMALHPGAVTA